MWNVHLQKRYNFTFVTYTSSKQNNMTFWRLHIKNRYNLLQFEVFLLANQCVMFWISEWYETNMRQILMRRGHVGYVTIVVFSDGMWLCVNDYEKRNFQYFIALTIPKQRRSLKSERWMPSDWPFNALESDPEGAWRRVRELTAKTESMFVVMTVCNNDLEVCS